MSQTLRRPEADHLELRLRAIESRTPTSFPKLERALVDAIQSNRVMRGIMDAAQSAVSSGINLDSIRDAATTRIDSQLNEHVRRTLREQFAGVQSLATREMVSNLSRTNDFLAERLRLAEEKFAQIAAENETLKRGAGALARGLKEATESNLALASRTAAIEEAFSKLSLVQPPKKAAKIDGHGAV